MAADMGEQNQIVSLNGTVGSNDDDDDDDGGGGGNSKDSSCEDEEEDDGKEEPKKPPSCFKPLKPTLIESQKYLKAEVTVRAGATDLSCSILASILERELCDHGQKHFRGIGSPRDSTHRSHMASGGFSASQKAFLANSFLPNRRKIIDKVRTRTFCCCYSPNGTTLLTASQDQQIRIYERRGYQQRYYRREEIASPFVGWSILDLIVSPDARHCVYSTWSDKLYQCKIDATEASDFGCWTVLNLNQQSDDNRFAFFSIRLNCDGRQIIGGASDGCIYMYDREKGQCFMNVGAHEDDINAVCFGDRNGHLFFSGGDDGICKVWDIRALISGDRPVGAFGGHRDGITFIDSKGDDRYILTNSKDQTVKLWDIRRFSSVSAQKRTKEAVSAQRWDYRYQPAPRGLINCRPLEDDGSIYTFRGGHFVLHTLVRARFSPLYTGQRYIYTGCARGVCALYDILTGQVVSELKGHQAVVRDCIWHPFENEIVTTSWDGITALWRFDERRKRNINPEFASDDLGDEDTSDELYHRVSQRKRTQKRKACVDI